MKKNLLILIFVLMIVTVLSFYFFVFKPEEVKPVICPDEQKECPDGTFVKKIPPKCEFESCPGEEDGILIFSPKRNEKIKSSIKIEGQARGLWFFEAQFNAKLFDENENFLGEAILTAKSDWMTENFVSFEGELIFMNPSSESGVLRFLSANPSGLPEHQMIFDVPVQFEKLTTRKVLLYYYNPEKDKDEWGNTKCSRNGLVPIEREIPLTKTPIQDTINLLLKGKENLTIFDTARGITTEYPLESFSLVGANLKDDGTLILEFNDPLNKTGGGSCRVGILWFQVEATAKQFPQVKKVQFLPEELFQP